MGNSPDVQHKYFAAVRIVTISFKSTILKSMMTQYQYFTTIIKKQCSNRSFNGMICLDDSSCHYIKMSDAKALIF
ncbi:hypothetical protein BKE30_05255 [Alkanindiges hydrocarboniclasticus]|uniref:Uncharacterized protein n=1 Tax=Alkanindiges hydrocarboniclasticus TaxID=1907941 RepID=A0A1S8CWJ2_9GAMM|nr:hypothetical protein BKE30_05255 [Alkanindiges hydrocarboniclasticus]